MPEPINEFYAVTRTSVYHVQAHGEYRASATKVALKGDSVIGVGEELTQGGMIAVGRVLIGYIPEKYGMAHPMTGYERNPLLVNTAYWHGSTSPIVGLFKDRDAAMACLEAEDRQTCDPRWLDSTKQVLAEIGEDHPSFFITHDDKYDLLKQAA